MRITVVERESRDKFIKNTIKESKETEIEYAVVCEVSKEKDYILIDDITSVPDVDILIDIGVVPDTRVIVDLNTDVYDLSRTLATLKYDNVKEVVIIGDSLVFDHLNRSGSYKEVRLVKAV
jgi:hypothetical protein